MSEAPTRRPRSAGPGRPSTGRTRPRCRRRRDRSWRRCGSRRAGGAAAGRSRAPASRPWHRCGPASGRSAQAFSGRTQFRGLNDGQGTGGVEPAQFAQIDRVDAAIVQLVVQAREIRPKLGRGPVAGQPQGQCRPRRPRSGSRLRPCRLPRSRPSLCLRRQRQSSTRPMTTRLRRIRSATIAAIRFKTAVRTRFRSATKASRSARPRDLVGQAQQIGRVDGDQRPSLRRPEPTAGLAPWSPPPSDPARPATPSRPGSDHLGLRPAPARASSHQRQA